MKLIIGLGNPGKEYTTTRHNAGWIAVDGLAKLLGEGDWRSHTNFESEILEISPNPMPTGRQASFPKEGDTGLPPFGKGGVRGISYPMSEKLLLVKPTTFMNNSGRAVEAIRAYYKVDPSDIIVIHDELDLPLGTVRTRLGGNSAGHNGVASVIHHLGTDQFWRVRIGIETGHPQRLSDPAAFVLDRFSKEEWAVLEKVVDETATNLLQWLNSGEIPETSFTVE